MADAAVSMLMEPLISTIDQWLKEEISLIKNVKSKLKHVSSKLRTIQSVLNDAEQRSVKEETVKVWLDELKDVSYEMDDVLDEWNTSNFKRKLEEAENPPDAPKEKISCSPWFTSCISPFKQVGFRHDIAWKIKDIEERLDSIIKEIHDFKFVFNQKSHVDSLKFDRVSTSIIKTSETYGRDSDKSTLLCNLLAEGSSHDQENRKIPIISIVGVGGLGKTTLAKLIYNDDEVVKKFSTRIWVCVSDPFDMYKVAREIIEAIDGYPPNESSPNLLLKHLKESISGKKFLLVLDDVWDEDGKNWKDLRDCLEDDTVGSRVIVTTRKVKVAKVMGTSTANLHNLEKLSEEACWSLFSQIAFDEEKKDHDMLTRIGREIVKKCKGLPLAVRTLGNVLRFKNTIEEWERVLHSEIWKMEKVEVELFPHLYLSYNELSPTLKMCFSYCSVFPKDTPIYVNELIKIWIAQGYVTSDDVEYDMELKGRDYFDKLAMSCFFQDFENEDFPSLLKCKMHDIVHDFSQYLTKNDSITIENGTPHSFSEKIRHLAWEPSELDESSSLSTFDIGKLRSFFVSDHSLELISIFKRLKCVRVLVLNCSLKKLPNEVGSLVHLRYLDLSGNSDLDVLPESVCELYNLQTLDMSSCRGLSRLPQMIGNLINLRHLFFSHSSLQEYPKSFGRLTNLRTLSEFKVGRKYGKLEFLQHLKHLRGSIRIMFDADVEEVVELVADVEKAHLKNNKYINQLVIVADGETGTEALWETLQPPPSVEILLIAGIIGTQYPSWLSNSLLLNNLRDLQIGKSTPNCYTLPPLGKLPQLEILRVMGNRCLKHIGIEFLGLEEEIEMVSWDGSSKLRRAPASSSSASVICAFPKLVELTLIGLENLEEWEDLNQEEEEEDSTNASSNIQIMPRLQKLALRGGEKLIKLPCWLLRKASSLVDVEISVGNIFIRNADDAHQHLMKQLLSHITEIQVDGVIYTPDNPGPEEAAI